MFTTSGTYPWSQYSIYLIILGDTCEDSSECFEGCCITIRRHRYGILQVCARENGPFMCVMGLNELTDELTRRS